MIDFQTIAGLASITSLVISVFALFRVNSVRKYYKKEIFDIRVKVEKVEMNTINYYAAAEGKLSGISDSIEELNEIPAVANSEDDLKRLHIWSKTLDALKSQYKEYRDIHRLPHDSKKVIELLAEISDLEFDINKPMTANDSWISLKPLLLIAYRQPFSVA